MVLINYSVKETVGRLKVVFEISNYYVDEQEANCLNTLVDLKNRHPQKRIQAFYQKSGITQNHPFYDES